MAIAKVEPLTSARALRGPFDYRLPPKMDARVGSVLRIPFGRQRLLGVVTALTDRTEIPEDKLAEPLEVIDAGPVGR
jgi:primosomal protein N' (replication factor Y)